MAVAVLALFGAEGAHDVLHRDDWSRVATTPPASGHAEIHSGNCPHRQDVHDPHSHVCVLCKGAHAHDLLAAPTGAVSVTADPCGRLVADAAHLAPLAGIPGTLGARGPPMTTA